MITIKISSSKLVLCGLFLVSTPVVYAEPGFLEWVGEKIAGSKVPEKKKITKQPDATLTSIPVRPEEVYRGIAPPRDGRAWIQMATSPALGALELIIITVK